MIYHNRYLTITNIDEMGQYAFSNLEGWKDFPQKAKKGDLVITGKNFGCGSSRQQAVDCFRALGIGMIIAESFGAIYERNAINSGFPIMAAQDIKKLTLKDGDEIEVDLMSGQITKLSTGETIKVTPFSEVQLDIYQRGGLLM
jgi:3-isopropylmalate dehydratase small subunit